MRINHFKEMYAFLAKDYEGNIFYLDSDGFSTPIKKIVFYYCTSIEAREESNRRGISFSKRFNKRLKYVKYQRTSLNAENDLEKLKADLFEYSRKKYLQNIIKK